MALIEDDIKKLRKLELLLAEYAEYLRERERQPLSAQSVSLVKKWVDENIVDLG